jgi:hypothetical protein
VEMLDTATKSLAGFDEYSGRNEVPSQDS